MNIPPRPKGHRITSDVPEHLLEAFQHTVTEFSANAHGGQTSAQRAAEIRVGDRDRGFDSLLQLVDVTEGGTDQTETVAEFLAGLYNGTTIVSTSQRCGRWTTISSSTVSPCCDSITGRLLKCTAIFLAVSSAGSR